MLEEIRADLLRLHFELPKNNLVTWNSGNISVRDQETGCIVIEPSGIRYESLQSEQMVTVDLAGRKKEGDLNPSSDLESHGYIYQHRPDVNAIVHTHSPFATASAALGLPIPVYLTAQVDEFGCAIPCGGSAPIGSDEIGRIVVEPAVKTAGMVERLHRRYTHVYGQEKWDEGDLAGRNE